MLVAGEALPGSPTGEVTVVGDAQVPAVQVGLDGELVGAQHGHVEVLVAAGGRADEQVDGLAARDPPADPEALQQGGDLLDGQRLPGILDGHNASMAAVVLDRT